MLIKNLFITGFMLLLSLSCNVASLITDAETKLGENFGEGGIYKGLMHFYRLEEGAGQTRYDSIGNLDFNDYNGWSVPSSSGAFDNAADGTAMSAGTGAVLHSSSYFSFNTNGNINVSFWMYLNTAPTTTNYIFHSGNFEVLVNTSSEIRVSFDAGGTSAIFNSIIPSLTSWDHYSINCELAYGFCNLYVNGVFQLTSSGFSLGDPSSTNNTMLSDQSGSVYASDIKLDSFGIWDRVLSESEIGELYNFQTGLD